LLAVSMYLTAFPLHPGQDFVRGFFAGAALRLSLFIGHFLVAPISGATAGQRNRGVASSDGASLP
jgi:hypothetical protein